MARTADLSHSFVKIAWSLDAQADSDYCRSRLNSDPQVQGAVADFNEMIVKKTASPPGSGHARRVTLRGAESQRLIFKDSPIKALAHLPQVDNSTLCESPESLMRP